MSEEETNKEATPPENTTTALEPVEPDPVDPKKPDTSQSLPVWMERLRGQLKDLEKTIRSVPAHSCFQMDEDFEGQFGEMIAQSKLAVRDVESARMRLGKVIQYHEGGTSIYDSV